MRPHSMKRNIAGLCLALLTFLTIGPALAGDHGGGGGGGNTPIKFTTNLGNNKYLQFEMVLEPAKPEAEQALGSMKPRLQHQIILLLSEATFESLITLKGKLELQETIKEVANKLIEATEKTGIKEVLFTSFIIQ